MSAQYSLYDLSVQYKIRVQSRNQAKASLVGTIVMWAILIGLLVWSFYASIADSPTSEALTSLAILGTALGFLATLWHIVRFIKAKRELANWVKENPSS